jgi:hypothetical protein
MEARAPSAAPVFVSHDSASDHFMQLLVAFDGIVSADERSWAATVSVDAVSPLDAAFAASETVRRMAEKAGMPAWPIVRTEVVRQDVLHAENEAPRLPDIVSVPEVAVILDVSRQRVHELARHTGFPEPVYELPTGRLWLRAAVEAFAQRWERKPGRPRKSAAAG